MDLLMDRRGLLKAASGLIASSAFGLPAFAADATPKKGGTFRLGISGGSSGDTLDPAKIATEFLSSVQFTIRNCLIELDDKSNLVPELAESWEPSKDFKTWTFKLRKGVQFHNGKDFGADDVIFTMNRHRGPNSQSNFAGVANQIADLKKTNDHEVVFILEDGNADFPYILTDMMAAICPSNEAGVLSGMGTGPYKLTNFQPGVTLETERNPNYWKQGRAHFDKVILLPINDTNARVSALLAGSVDAIDRLDARFTEQLSKKSSVVVSNIVGTRFASFPMLCNAAPFDNNDFRMAVKYAMNRKDIIERVFHGYASLGNDHPVSSIQKYYAKDLPQRDYDPDKAKFHLKKSGYSGGAIDLKVCDAPFNGAVGTAAVFKETAAACGLDINIVQVPQDGFWTNVWMKAPFTVSYWSGRPTADWILTLCYNSTSTWNESAWKSDSFDKLLKQARVEQDQPKRTEMYAALQKQAADESGDLIPFFMNNLYARQKNVMANTEAGNFQLDGLRMAERWWFA
ncbi:MAG: ABC transporter substrate-binding protein [Pseudomonadota bacterium]